MSAAMYNDGLA